jgi:hypothetical protein
MYQAITEWIRVSLALVVALAPDVRVRGATAYSPS